MASKKTKENKKDKSIHKTAKNKSAGGNEKNTTIGKIKDLGKNNSETRSHSKTRNTRENVESKKEAQPDISESEKTSEENILIIDDEDLEGMSVPPQEDQPSSPGSQGARYMARPSQRPTVTPAQKPTPAPSRRKPSSAPASSTPSKPSKRPQAAESPSRRKKEESTEDEDDEEDAPVKQFSFPAYKILSGASVAPVQMFPQKVVINPSEENGGRPWGSFLTGLFQNSKLSLKQRMLRLILIWVFFRVLNKQTAWLSDMLGIGVPDEEPPGPKVKPPPGERYVKVFREGDPNPFHVRVKKPL